MKIVALEAENVKHLKVVNIKPDGSLVVIGGDNAAGKSCVLDSIEYALGGASAVPTKPIRSGQKKARIVLDLGDIEVTRTFTKKGTNLTVKNKKGKTFTSPQAMLDKLVGKLTFDPLEFSKMDAKKQSEVLKQLVGLDFGVVDARQKRLFDNRTEINRDGKAKKATLDSMTRHKDAPGVEVSVDALGKEFRTAIDHNHKLEAASDELTRKAAELARLEGEVKRLKREVNNAQLNIKDCGEKIDTEQISLKIGTAESDNGKVRENRIYDKTEKEVQGLRIESQSLSHQMAELESKKAAALVKAKFPVEGLSIGEEVVEFKGIPFDQCSTAQQIRISVAIGLATNPDLRVLLVREGSLLDESNLAMVAKMAEDADSQIWLERVSKGSECTVILEDGSIVE